MRFSHGIPNMLFLNRFRFTLLLLRYVSCIRILHVDIVVIEAGFWVYFGNIWQHAVTWQPQVTNIFPFILAIINTVLEVAFYCRVFHAIVGFKGIMSSIFIYKGRNYGII